MGKARPLESSSCVPFGFGPFRRRRNWTIRLVPAIRLRSIRGRERGFRPCRSCWPDNPCIRNSPRGRSSPVSSYHRQEFELATDPARFPVFADLSDDPWQFSGHSLPPPFRRLKRVGRPRPAGWRREFEKKDGRLVLVSVWVPVDSPPPPPSMQRLVFWAWCTTPNIMTNL